MGNLLFSPSGRIGPGQFMSGVTVLIVISLILALLPIFVPALTVLGIVGLVLIWCWIVLWIKRYHDAGKSGWMCLLPIIVLIILSAIMSSVLAGMFVDTAAAEAMAEAAEAGDFSGLMKMAGTGGMTTTGAIISAVASAVLSYVVAMVFNGMIKHDAHDNQYGPEAGTS